MTNHDDDPIGQLTRRENIHYLLTELERAIERGGIEWDATSALAAQKRLDRLAAIVQQIAAGFRRH
jgi:hypothetical protein